MADLVLSLVDVVHQTDIWVDGARLEEMDRHHRSNLIPFLRGNKCRLYLANHRGHRGMPDPLVCEEWLLDTPLMTRLLELERDRPIEERRETALRNAAHEKATGYRKIREPQALERRP